MRSEKKLLVVLLFLVATCGCCLFAPLTAVGNMASHGANDFQNQCDSAIGPDPSSTVTATPAQPSRTVVSQAPLPSTNPYSSMTVAADDPNISDRYRACVAALKSAPYQAPGAIQMPNAGVAAACAQQLALRYAQGGAGDPAGLARDVVYAASSAALTGQCIVIQAPPGADAVPSGCGDPNGPRRLVVLPPTVGQQGYCGQQVVASAVTAGDLVFWDYRDNAATRVGIAVSPMEMVTGNSGGGAFFRLPIPETRDVRVKRVLGGDV
ncbi:hypothetical protein [Nocardia sp. NBC_01329]|uniref:hypothetical protein n=1 Tax=Nocardia sp. NBC_01329 TaxID=2903594 RepID=UPI002E1362FE|nr:hypothetical protein OG405_20175 [Nocardia sp. NBC_01329]